MANLNSDIHHSTKNVISSTENLSNLTKIMLMFMNFSLQAIEKDHHTPGDRFTAMLGAWFQSSPNPTWSQVVEALRSLIINRHDIADEIEDKYIKSDYSSVQESKGTAGE